MKLYFKIILTAMTVIAAANIVMETAVWYYVISLVVWCTALQFALDGIIAITVSKMPDRWFSVDNEHFRVSEREREIYKKLGVRKWKNKIWELGGLGGFSKKKIKEPKNPLYIEKFIVECNRGVVIHRLSYFVGFLAMLTVSNKCAFTIAFPVATVNLFLNFLPTIVLRDNTPKLKMLLSHMKKREEQAAKYDAFINQS